MLHYIGLYEELSKELKKKVTIDGQSILLIFLLDHVYAIQDKCSHLGVSLSKGTQIDEHIQCQAHHAKFNVKTGDVIDKAHIGFIKMPTKKLKTFKTEVTEGKVYIEL